MLRVKSGEWRGVRGEGARFLLSPHSSSLPL